MELVLVQITAFAILDILVIAVKFQSVTVSLPTTLRFVVMEMALVEEKTLVVAALDTQAPTVKCFLALDLQQTIHEFAILATEHVQVQIGVCVSMATWEINAIFQFAMAYPPIVQKFVLLQMEHASPKTDVIAKQGILETNVTSHFALDFRQMIQVFVISVMEHVQKETFVFVLCILVINVPFLFAMDLQQMIVEYAPLATVLACLQIIVSVTQVILAIDVRYLFATEFPQMILVFVILGMARVQEKIHAIANLGSLVPCVISQFALVSWPMTLEHAILETVLACRTIRVLVMVILDHNVLL